ncbi:putative molybdopterin binding domain protein [Roseivivax jejudonensis]|uniref:Putative molybdopterin binding domain protein n=1 Tax=Roseivivax jejudonensis TaxID=1529041 RepID=A0A1X6Z5M6_9RHOB|nr:molybdopterin-binding protein [Roseivivax jejudonensis]SLN41110.1 putative molybdopterin binding domain protein [Roseivivax jejudonensis]
MKFGSVPLDAAEGAILAHSVPLSKGRLKKGRALSSDDIAGLRDAGVADVVVARLEPGDVDEDGAAARLAAALVPDPDAAGLWIGPAATGRVNLFATAPGVVEIDAAKIDALNAIHPMITVATLRPWQRVAARTMVATVKIISYAVPGDALDRACAMGRDAMRARPVALRRAELIQTAVPGTQESGEKGQRAIGERLDRLGVDLAPVHIVDHRIAPLAEALAASEAEALLILTGSATSDIADVAPEAVRHAGGEVHHYGMPVDPGNLLFLGELGGRPVVGLPGCARSPALNGADWVLERLLCGVEVTPRDIAGMGVGGLLKEVAQRGRPREG